MDFKVITQKQKDIRKYWVNEISLLSGSFGANSKHIEEKIRSEIINNGIDALLGHLRLCGAMPEIYGHDTSEEKLYSKYTDVVIFKAYEEIGFRSLVLKERADVADVECYNDQYSFVADAKSFRLSRTAKNQKDFKVQAMDNWKHGKPYAMVVCPIYQLPCRTSQIYQQASARSVCILTYNHLSVIVQYANLVSHKKAMDLILEVFRSIEAMNPSKNASSYWQVINRTMLDFNSNLSNIWRDEKIAIIESIYISRQEALCFLAKERERIMKLSREDAIKEVIKLSKIQNKIKAINSVTDNDILSCGV